MTFSLGGNIFSSDVMLDVHGISADLLLATIYPIGPFDCLYTM